MLTGLPTAHILHGFNVRDHGAGTLLRLTSTIALLGYCVRRWPFGWRFLLSVRFGNARRARQIAATLKPGDLLVGHSDGCNLADLAARYASLPPKSLHLLYFNPALNRCTKLPETVATCTLYASPNDRALWWARWLPAHRWGDLGRVGPVYPRSPLHSHFLPGYRKKKLGTG